MGLGMPLFLHSSRRNRCAPFVSIIRLYSYRDGRAFCQRSIIGRLMELRTQAVDKILEALAPALSAELERVLQEARQQQEEEFRKRLESAIREAESAAMRLAETQKEQAVKDACDKVSAELQNQFQQTLRQTIDQLGADFASRSEAAAAQWDVEKTRLQDQVDLWRTYAEGQRQLAESGSQAEMLTRFLNLVEPFAGAVAVYVAKADGLALWKSRGKGAFSNLVSQDTIDPESFFKPLVVREKTVAAVCAVQPYKTEPLEFLSACLGRSIEAFGMKLQTPVPRPGASAPPTAPPAPAPPAAPVADEKLGAEARLAARLLVSEIKLYNEQDVRDGRAASDLYVRLQKHIEQGRDQYRQRIDTGVVSRDYYHEELVRVLADGETSRLGSDYPGPVTG